MYEDQNHGDSPQNNPPHSLHDTGRPRRSMAPLLHDPGFRARRINRGAVNPKDAAALEQLAVIQKAMAAANAAKKPADK
jgi:hypothetical protein